MNRYQKKRTLQRALPLILTLALFFQGMIHACHASITFDEGPHLAVGYTTLRTGDFRLQPVHIHPPLANVLAALPVSLQRDLPDPRTVGGWEISSLSAITDRVVWQYPEPRRIAIAGRLPILGLGVILAALVFRWAKDRGGTVAGLTAMAFLVFDPNVVAHSSLITTDVAAVTLMLLSLYLTDRWVLRKRTDGQRRNPKRRYITSVGIGLVVGLAQLTKVSALLLIPVIISLIVLKGWAGSKVLWKSARYVIPSSVLLIATTGLVVWAGYGFEVRPVSGLSAWPVPAATHVEIFRSLRQHYDLGHPTFAAGKLSRQGWWWYFPLAFLIKTPLPFLILLLTIGVALMIYEPVDRLREAWLRYAGLWIFPLLYGIASLFSSVNIGYRHLLPLLPVFSIAAGIGISRLHKEVRSSRIRWLNLALLALLVWQTAGTLHVGAHPLAFFNELIGGPTKGHRYLVDSNLDWGQNLWDLKEWMTQHNEGHVNYAHYSPARPQAYGIDASYLPPDPRAESFAPWAPPPGLYAIGATVLQGPYAPTRNTYAWFRGRSPVARLGHALFIYRVEAQPPVSWVVLCGGTGFEPGQIHNLLGQMEVRILQPDCEQTRVVPAGPGLTVLPSTITSPNEESEDFAVRAADGSVTAVIDRVDHTPEPPHPLPETVRMGPLTFLGHSLSSEHASPGETLHLRTYWRVESLPTRALSLMAHLVEPEGTVASVGDSLGFPIEQWQLDDIMVQEHRLAILQNSSPGRYALHVGGYWLDTMTRWPVSGTATKDFLVVASVEVE